MILYKYFPPERLDVVRERRIRFTQPGDFNDPFEFRPTISPVVLRDQVLEELDRKFDERVDDELTKYGAMLPPLTRELLLSHREALRSNLPALVGSLVRRHLQHVEPMIHGQLGSRVGVMCLSEVRDSILMWGHYTDSHRGFVLGFDSEHEFFKMRRGPKDEFGYLRKVVYQVQRPGVDMSNTDSVEWFQTKSQDWAYEREWRIVRALTDATESIARQPFPICLFSFAPTAIKEIIIGMRAEPDLITEARDLARGLPGVLLLRAKGHPTEYAVDFETA